MRGVYTFACVFVALGTAAANTYVGPSIIPSCSSSSDLVIAVTSLQKGAGGVRVDIYREIQNGERAYWTGRTGQEGTVRPPALEPGEYRVFADSGKLSGTMSLIVGLFKSTGARCELRIGAPYSAESGGAMPEQPEEIQLRELRGVVVDDKEVPIPHVIVRVLRAGSSGYLAQLQSDEKGQFELHLNEGSYIATFAYQGFRTRMVAFRLGSAGWPGCELGMIPDGASRHDPPAVEWTRRGVTDNWLLATDNWFFDAQTH